MQGTRARLFVAEAWVTPATKIRIVWTLDRDKLRRDASCAFDFKNTNDLWRMLLVFTLMDLMILNRLGLTVCSKKGASYISMWWLV